jgi:hypothetical protein
VTIDVCPACGYPTVGPDLCAFCRPLDGEWMPGRNSTTWDVTPNSVPLTSRP